MRNSVNTKIRTLAVLLCIVLVLGSIYIGARRSLLELVEETETAFIDGVDGDGYSIYNDLQNRVGCAYNLVAIAQRYYSEDDALLEAVNKAADALDGEKSPSKAYDYNETLTKACNALYEALGTKDLSDRDANDREGQMANFNSYAYTISHDGYNELVRTLNEGKLAQFPAKYLKIITFVGNADYFK